MALEGPRLLSGTFPAYDTTTVTASTDNDIRLTRLTIPLSGLTDGEALTLGFDGVQIQHSFNPVVFNVANGLYLQFAPMSAPTDPRETIAYFPGLDYILETLYVSEDPISDAEMQAGFVNLQEVIYHRSAYYGSINTQADRAISAMSAVSLVEGGTMRPTTRDRLYVVQRLQAQGAWDPTAADVRDLDQVTWAFPDTSVLIAARLIREGDLAYLDRTVASYMRG